METTTRTDIIGIELVNSYECTGSSEPEGPSHKRTPDRELAFMQIVGKNGVELFSTHPKRNTVQSAIYPPVCLLLEMKPPQTPTPGLTPICEWTTKLRARTPSRMG